ncbi:MAG: hypothetical protein AAFS10_24330 [Myxococcota bacterium]
MEQCVLHGGYTPVVRNKTICLRSPTGGEHGCATLPRSDDMSDEDYFVARALHFHDAILRPSAKIDRMSLRALNGAATTPSGGNKGLRELAPKDDGK